MKLSKISTGLLLLGLSGLTFLSVITAQNSLPQYNELYVVQWSPDGTKLLAGEATGMVIVWDAFTGEELYRFDGHNSETFSGGRGKWSPDGRLIATYSQNNSIRIWDAQTGSLLQTLSGHTKDVGGVSWSPDGSRLLSISDDNTARVWDTTTWQTLVVFNQHTAPLNDAEWSHDGMRITTASEDGTGRIWDANTGDELFIFTDREPSPLAAKVGSTVEVLGVAWSPDDTQLAVTGSDGMGIIWDAISGEKQFVLRAAPGEDFQFGLWILDAFWSPDGSRIILHSPFEFPSTVWDTTTGDLLFMLEGDSDFMTRARWNADGSEIMTTGLEGKIRCWDGHSGNLLRVIDARSSIWSAEYSPDGFLIASTASNGTIRLWDAQSGAEQAFIFPPASSSEIQVTLVFEPTMRAVEAEIEPTLQALQAGVGIDILDITDTNTGTLSGTGPVFLTYFGSSGESLSLQIQSEANITLRVLDISLAAIGESSSGSLTVALSADSAYFVELTDPTATTDSIVAYELIASSTFGVATPTP
ncbi:MAG: WD40 repeat domain-containing protein [Anaerolineaceae bacterium]|nr:WD40 repeat domain-containing protein [Anaerolineaceae bacterium]